MARAEATLVETMKNIFWHLTTKCQISCFISAPGFLLLYFIQSSHSFLSPLKLTTLSLLLHTNPPLLSGQFLILWDGGERVGRGVA